MSNDNAEKHPLQRLLEQVDANVRSFRRRSDGPLAWFTSVPTCLAVEAASLAAFTASMVETIITRPERTISEGMTEDEKAIVEALRRLEWSGSLVIFPTVAYVDDHEPPSAA